MTKTIVKSASRALQVLELFSERRRPLRLHEIYESLGVPQSSATHLMKSMLRMGYVNYNRSTRTYLPTNKVSNLGNWLTGAAFGQPRLRALADRLQEATDETVAVSTQNDLFIQYVIIRAPKEGHRMRSEEGTMRLMTKSTAGMALLSRMTDRRVDNICRHINYYESNAIDRVDVPAVMREVRWTRQVGYSFRADLPVPGVASLAFPLDDTLHGIPLSLSIGGYKDRLAHRKSELLAITRRIIADFAAERPPADLFPDVIGIAPDRPTAH